MARLVIFDDRVRGVDLPEGPLIIGRSTKSDIPINDTLLSRKHCAIIPSGGGYRLVDLRSSNGTFLNGARVDRVDLTYDDIIEIGNTVIVFLDAEAWNRGEGLARLRNPVKAQELIQRIRLHQKQKERIPIRKVSPPGSRLERTRLLLESLPIVRNGASDGTAGDGGVLEEDLLDLLVDFALHKTVSLLVRQHSDLKRQLARAVENALLSSVAGNWNDLRNRLREEVSRRLASSGNRGKFGKEEAGQGQEGTANGTSTLDGGTRDAESQIEEPPLDEDQTPDPTG